MPPQESQKDTSFIRAVVIGAALSLVIGVIVLAFSWPAVTAKASDLPVGVVGPADRVDEVREQIDDSADGAVALTEYSSRDDAVEAIERREVYGAVVLGDEATDAPEVLIASAANASVAQLLTSIASQMQIQIDAGVLSQLESTLPDIIAQAVQSAVEAIQTGQAPDAGSGGSVDVPTVEVTVTDVVPLSGDDPNGTGLTVAMFPLVLGGIVGGVVLSLLVRGALRRVAGVVVYAAVGGLVITAILQSWFGVLQGGFLANWAAISLSVSAIAAAITGIVGLVGTAGLGVGAVLVMLVGNPISAASMPVEFLARPWGAVGQWFPPGAAATLVRDLSYFPAADTTFPWLVLAGWTVAGLLLSLLAHARGPVKRARHAEAPSDGQLVAA